jgi:beta-alanine degradation protein BauB
MNTPHRPAAVGTLKAEDAHMRVTEWRFAPGAATGWHRHEYDYVVVPMLDGKLGLEEPGGVTREAALTRGVPYHRQAGVEHDVININDFEFAFLEIELKQK